jgi:hypothetical protein
MKRCPQCDHVEADNMLAFCRVDGTALIPDSLNEDSATIRFNSAPISGAAQTHALASSALTDPGRPRVQPTTVLPTQQANENTRASQSKRRKAIAALATLVAVALSACVYLYWSHLKKATPIESIAVLPFQNKNSGADTE